MSVLAAVDVHCPECGDSVRVEIVADSGVIVDGVVKRKLCTRYEHECGGVE